MGGGGVVHLLTNKNHVLPKLHSRPLNYDCAVRKVALEYATKLAADPTTARSAVDVKTVYDALALERDCENTAWETAAAQLAAAKAAHSSATPSPTAAPEQPRR